MKCLWVKFGLG